NRWRERSSRTGTRAPARRIYLSGAHAYGFPSPDSDLDLKCVHVAPTGELVGLEPVSEPADRIVVIDGVELDDDSNELGAVLRGAIQGNGNFLERILGELTLGGDRGCSLGRARSCARCCRGGWRGTPQGSRPASCGCSAELDELIAIKQRAEQAELTAEQ